MPDPPAVMRATFLTDQKYLLPSLLPPSLDSRTAASFAHDPAKPKSGRPSCHPGFLTRTQSTFSISFQRSRYFARRFGSDPIICLVPCPRSDRLNNESVRDSASTDASEGVGRNTSRSQPSTSPDHPNASFSVCVRQGKSQRKPRVCLSRVY